MHVCVMFHLYYCMFYTTRLCTISFILLSADFASALNVLAYILLDAVHVYMITQYKSHNNMSISHYQIYKYII